MTEWLLDMLEAVLDAVLGLLPEWNEDPFASWQMVLDNLGALNYWLPISEVFAFTISVILLAPLLLGINFTVWLIAMIRGGSSRG